MGDDQDNTDTQYGLRASSFDYVPLDNETYEKEYSDNIDSTNKTSVILGDKDYSELENSIFGDNDTPKESYRDNIRNDDMHLNEVVDEAEKEHVSSHDDERKERDDPHKLPKNKEEDIIGHVDVSMESLEKYKVDEESKNNDVSKNGKGRHPEEIHSVDNLP